MTKSDRNIEIERNLQFFLKELPSLLPQNRGKFALIRHQSLEGYYDTIVDAVKTGNMLYSDKMFSVQQVTDAASDLGFYSHAVPVGHSQ
jgi:hypothetical protein